MAICHALSNALGIKNGKKNSHDPCPHGAYNLVEYINISHIILKSNIKLEW